jgi:radical SAM protein with 4Fe4S-binding SPASM domain
MSDTASEARISEVFHCYSELHNENYAKWLAMQPPEYHEYRRQWSQVPERLEVTDRPLHLDIEVTSRCNLLCPFCARTQRVEKGVWRNAGDMDFDLFKKIVDDMAENRVFAMNMNVLGEPLIHKRIKDMVSYAKQKGIIDVFFHTNAVLLNDKMSRDLINSGLDRLVISFDSPYKEKYEAVRVNAKYDKVLKNIIRFNQIREEMGRVGPLTRLNFIKLPGVTEQEIHDVIELFKPHIDSIGLLDYIEGDNDVRKTFEADENYKSNFVCSQILTRLTVYDDGTVLPCCSDYDSELILGNLKDQTIQEIWNSDRLNEIRQLHFVGQFYKIPACAKCDYALQADRKYCGMSESEKQ